MDCRQVSDIVPVVRRRNWLILSFVSIHLITVSADASQPVVTFDIRDVVVCRDITTDEFAASNPGQKLIEAKFQISSLIRGDAQQLAELFHRIESPRPDLRVVDYHPRTTLDTDIASNVGVETGVEATRSAVFGLAGKYDGYLSGDASASKASKDSTTYRYELLPPMDLVAASGTTRRGTGAYFKLRPSPRTSLEGAKDFVIILRVPQSWRADYVRVTCESLGRTSGGGLIPSDLVPCGRARFLVALHQEGDASARRAAENFVYSASRLHTLAHTHEREIRKRSLPSFAHRLGRAFSVMDPKIPENWLDRVIRSPAHAEMGTFVHRLPDEIHTAAAIYKQAKVELSRMRG